MKKDVLIYKGYIGSVHFSAKDRAFYGKLEGISELITFEGQDVAGVETAFQAAVEDYLEICEQTGKTPMVMDIPERTIL